VFLPLCDRTHVPMQNEPGHSWPHKLHAVFATRSPGSSLDWLPRTLFEGQRGQFSGFHISFTVCVSTADVLPTMFHGASVHHVMLCDILCSARTCRSVLCLLRDLPLLLLWLLRCFRSCFLFWHLGGRADLGPQCKEYHSSARLFRIFKIVSF
jgi:hypothetical protein